MSFLHCFEVPQKFVWVGGGGGGGGVEGNFSVKLWLRPSWTIKIFNMWGLTTLCFFLRFWAKKVPQTTIRMKKKVLLNYPMEAATKFINLLRVRLLPGKERGYHCYLIKAKNYWFTVSEFQQCFKRIKEYKFHQYICLWHLP